MSLNKLKKKYQFITVENTTGIVQTIHLVDEHGNPDTIDVQPEGTRKIETKLLIQLPDPSVLRLVDPKLATLIEEGTIKPKDVTEAESADDSDEDDDADEGEASTEEPAAEPAASSTEPTEPVVPTTEPATDATPAPQEQPKDEGAPNPVPGGSDVAGGLDIGDGTATPAKPAVPGGEDVSGDVTSMGSGAPENVKPDVPGGENVTGSGHGDNAAKLDGTVDPAVVNQDQPQPNSIAPAQSPLKSGDASPSRPVVPGQHHQKNRHGR